MTKLYTPFPTAIVHPKHIKIQAVVVIILSLMGQSTLAQTSLRFTEIYPGQAGSDLTADWFEIVNTGDENWISGVSENLYCEDESLNAANGDAILIPVVNFEEIVSSEVAPNSAICGIPIELDLERHRFRSFDCNGYGCLILAGSFANITDFRLFTWSGNPADPPEIMAADLKSLELGNYDAREGDIVINEVMQNPSLVPDNSGEWLELFNNTFTSVDINGWIISDAGTDIDTIDHGEPLVVPARGYLVLGVNADLAGNGNVMVDYEYDAGFALANGADELILRASDGTLVDSIAWDGGTDWPDPIGASMSLKNPDLDNNDGSNWCVSDIAFGDGDFGTPSMDNYCALPPAYDLQITEAWVGQTTGSDLTADWFEITNFGDLAWVNSTDPNLYFVDESQDPNVADPINGISEILPGKSIVVVIGNESDATTFRNIWSPDYNLDEVETGWTDGAGLGQEGDGVTLFVGTPSVLTIVDFESFPAVPSGVSWDVVLGAFSQQGVGTPQVGTNVAVATTATNGVESAIGSPGNEGPVSTLAYDLKITEIFSGQTGAELTADWFEIVNEGNTAWTQGIDSDLYYDDDSQDPWEATLIEGISQIDTGAAAIIVIGTEEDVATFIGVWGEVIVLDGVEIGFTDGSDLVTEGDLVIVWAGDPQLYAPVDTASYPDTEADDGKSYDVSLMAFSEAGNENGAVQTLVMGGDGGDVPNIASPGNMGATTRVYIPDISEFVNIVPNPGIGEFTISISEGHKLLNSTVYDITGQKVFFLDYQGSEFTTTLDLKSLERGMYLLRLHMEQGIAVKRIIKE